MKKPILFIAATAVALSSVFVGCKKEITQDEDAVYVENDQLSFAVTVMDASTSQKASSGIEGATVSMNGTEVTTDANGVADFGMIAPGDYTISIMATDYATLTSTVNVEAPDGENSSASVTYGMLATAGAGTATISGMMDDDMYDWDNDTTADGTGVANWASLAPDVPPTTLEVTATVTSSLNGLSTDGAGVVVYGTSFSGLTMTTNLAADGTYSLTVPATVDGLTIQLRTPAWEGQELWVAGPPKEWVPYRHAAWTNNVTVETGKTYTVNKSFN